jgi:hypothetical protein
MLSYARCNANSDRWRENFRWKTFVFMTSNKTDVPAEIESIPLKGKKVF